MATSSKVVFSLATLRSKALESLDFKIAQKRAEVEGYDSPELLSERMNEWRERQQKKLHAAYSRLESGELDDHQLAQFRLDEIPRVELHDRRRAEAQLRGLEIQRVEMAAKTESLVPDADGNIALTKTQLQEFFSL